MHNTALQPTANPLRGLSAAELGRLCRSLTHKDRFALRKMKSIYLESSVVSYLAARPTRDLVVAGNQQVTRDWWEMRRGECELFVSDVVVAECAAGDPTAASERKVFLGGLPILATTKEAEALADALLSAMALPQKAALDALHIGIAAVNGTDILFTWNCAHIANPFMQPQINAACVEFGVIPPTICTPLQLVEA